MQRGLTTYKEIIWLDGEQLSEVTESNWSKCFEAKVTVVMCWCQVTAFSEKKKTQNIRLKYLLFVYKNMLVSFY